MISDLILFLLPLQPSPQELQTIIQGFNNADTLRQNGVCLGGQKYFYLQSDDSQIQAKKSTSGLSIAKANTCKYCSWFTFYIMSLFV